MTLTLDLMETTILKLENIAFYLCLSLLIFTIAIYLFANWHHVNKVGYIEQNEQFPYFLNEHYIYGHVAMVQTSY